MNKRKRVAIQKHRIKRKKVKLRRKQPAAAAPARPGGRAPH
jgi:hypothetical protein